MTTDPSFIGPPWWGPRNPFSEWQGAPIPRQMRVSPSSRYASPEHRFWANVVRGGPDECWLWTASTRSGYGSLRVDGKPVSAHRFSYEIHHRKPPGDHHVCHSCDNPGCVNPAHLWLGTAAQNQWDRSRKNRNNIGKISDVQVLLIRRDPRSSTAIAMEYGISTVQVCNIKAGRAHKHVTEEMVTAAERALLDKIADLEAEVARLRALLPD